MTHFQTPKGRTDSLKAKYPDSDFWNNDRERWTGKYMEANDSEKRQDFVSVIVCSDWGR